MVVEALDLRAGSPQIDPGRADADGGKLDRLRQTSPEAQSTSARFEADDPQGYTQPALPPEGECTADDPALVQHHEHQRTVLRKALREVVKTPFVMRDALAHLTGNDVKRPGQLRQRCHLLDYVVRLWASRTAHRTALDLGLEPGPTSEAVLAGECKLRGP